MKNYSHIIVTVLIITINNCSSIIIIVIEATVREQSFKNQIE